MDYDGQVVATATSSAAIVAASNPLLIGKRDSASGQAFPVDGRIDEVGIWDRALGDGEVASLYNSGAGLSLISATSPPQQFTMTLPQGSAGAGTLQVTVTTDSNNAVTEDNPSGTAQTNNTATISVSSSLAVGLSGEVYADNNGNGLLDGGEPGLSGWTLNLLNSSSQTIATTTTDANGAYSFPGIVTGTYTIAVVLQAGYIATSATTLPVNTSGGSNVLNLNFGEFHPVILSGEVFNDLSGSGKLNSGDPGLTGWTVNLVNSSNQAIAATTDVDGNFSFANVGPGTYMIEVVTQTGYVATSATTLTVTASSGSDISNLFFGEFQAVTISGEVYNDLNGNNVLDGGDGGLAGWIVDLLNSISQTIATVTTDSNGAYSFGSIGPGSYTVAVVTQSGYVASSAASLPINTTSGQNLANRNFGEFRTVILSGEVYNDLSGNGTLDNDDPGISGWTVNLLNNSNNVVATAATTDGSGDYSFTGVGPGSYTVVEVLKAGYAETTSPSGDSLTTTTGQNVTGLDFGNFQQWNVSGTLFEDSNQDGLLDGGETGLSGWTVNLSNGSNQVVASATTDSQGNYSFSNLPPGTYTIQEVLQAGYILTVPGSAGVTMTPISGAQINGENLGVFKAVSLAVTGLTTMPSSLQSSLTVIAEWSDTNAGTLPAGSFSDLLTVTNTTTGQVVANTALPYDAAILGELAVGASAPQQYAFRLPDGEAGVGQIQISVTTDVDNTVSTAQGDPGKAATLNETSTLAPYPDLVVSSITPPSAAWSGSGVIVGWAVTNQGQAATAGAWQDAVYLENVTTGTETPLGKLESPVNLSPGQSYDRAADFTLPVDISGNYEIVVSTNVDNGIYEPNTSNDTTTSAPFQISLTPEPELQVTSVTAPQQATIGQPVTISWVVSNAGTGATSVPSWVDSVYLSSSPTFNSSAILVGTVGNPSYLAPGGSYASSLTANLPNSISTGSYYAIVFADSSTIQYQYSYANDTSASTSTIEVIPAPSLPFIHVASVSVTPAPPNLIFSGTADHRELDRRKHGREHNRCWRRRLLGRRLRIVPEHDLRRDGWFLARRPSGCTENATATGAELQPRELGYPAPEHLWNLVPYPYSRHSFLRRRERPDRIRRHPPRSGIHPDSDPIAALARAPGHDGGGRGAHRRCRRSHRRELDRDE